MTHRLKRERNDDRSLVLLHGRAELPTYSSSNKFLTTQEAINVLLDRDLQQDEICSQVPFSVRKNGIFIVDLNRLGSPKDIMCDDMGVWMWSGSFKRWCLVSPRGFVKLYKKNISLLDLNADSYRIWKRYYYLKSSPDIRKMVILLEGMTKVSIACMQARTMYVGGWDMKLKGWREALQCMELTKRMMT